MAHSETKIFATIEKYLAQGQHTRTQLIQRLFDEKVVGSIGTAHRYVDNYLAQQAQQAPIDAPEVDPALLPANVLTAFEKVLAANSALKNEMAKAVDTITQTTGAAFATMLAAHNSAHQIEVEELASGVRRFREELNSTTHLLDEATANEAKLRSEVHDSQASVAELNLVVASLRLAVATHETRVATLVETGAVKSKTIASLESEREVWMQQAARSEQAMGDLQAKINELEVDLAALRHVEPALGQVTAERDAKSAALGAAEARADRLESRLFEITVGLGAQKTAGNAVEASRAGSLAPPPSLPP